MWRGRAAPKNLEAGRGDGFISPVFLNVYSKWETGEMVGYIFKWIYASTMEAADWGWIEDALVEYFEREGMHITLGPSSGDRCRVHSIKRFAKKVATNSALTAFKEKQMKSGAFQSSCIKNYWTTEASRMREVHGRHMIFPICWMNKPKGK